MFSCRAVWQRLSPGLRMAACSLPGPGLGLQRRAMSSAASGRGLSGESFLYILLVVGAAVGAGAYAVNMLNSDNARYQSRLAEIAARPKAEWVPPPWPPVYSKDEDEE